MAAIRSLACGRQQQFGLRGTRKGVPGYRRELREARTVYSPSPAVLRATLCTTDRRYALGMKKRPRLVPSICRIEQATVRLGAIRWAPTDPDHVLLHQIKNILG